MTDATAPRSELFALAERVVQDDAEHDPLFATDLGVVGYDHLLPRFDPARYAEDAERLAGHLRDVRAATAPDDLDRICRAVLEERLEARVGFLRTGESARTFGVLSSPLSQVRQGFELMRHTTDEDHAVIAQRLGAVREAMASWQESLVALADAGTLPARRHVAGVAGQARAYAGGTYRGFVERLGATGARRDELAAAAVDAEAACGALAVALDDLADRASAEEGCGPDRYPQRLRYFNGADLDVDELYAWGWEDLQRINARMWELAAQLAPGATRLVDVAAALDADDARAVVGTDVLLARLESFTQTTIDALDGVHFDVDPRVRRCDARLAPEGSAAAPYYIAMSEDFERPGTTWFPTLGRTRFPWWRLASTWYHEAVPGHHLQEGVAACSRDRLSRFQRTEAWTSGYGEGWALYAERLMEELGGFTDPGDELGYLEGQGLRAARVVVDLGLHLGLRAPKDLGELGALGDCSSRVWTPEMAVALLEERAIQDHEFATSEVDRYLSWPGQATSYKVGERVWLAARADARARLGSRFSLKAFHSFALRLGPMGLDPFRRELDGWDGA